MRRLVWIGLLFFCPILVGQSIDPIKPYELPPEVQGTFNQIAAETDVLVLGEVHGTREIPALCAALLKPLTEAGFGILALEVPAHQEKQLQDWAIGKRVDPPPFFTQGSHDGRDSVQILSLAQAAVRPPYNWRLACFDEELRLNATPAPPENKEVPPDPYDFVKLAVRRDTAMADHLITARSRITPAPKVLTLCGSIHARSALIRPLQDSKKSPGNDILSKLWPSFVASLSAKQPSWRVQSVHIVPASGKYSAVLAIGDEPPRAGVYEIQPAKHLERAAIRKLNGDSWDWWLDLPQVTAATFLSSDTDMHSK